MSPDNLNRALAAITGGYEAALDKLQAALELYRETGNRQGEGRTLNDIGDVCKYLGQY
jgi:tetratricopeptide (TPR) repeat protein